MTILALDQATRITGYAVYVAGNLISYGKIVKDNNDIVLRIQDICQEIQKKIDEWEPDVVVIENIAMQGGNVDTFHKLAWLQGAILYMCVQRKIKCDIIAPNEWRRYCNFLKDNDKHRDAQKKIAQTWVLSTFGQKCTQDEADAICIGYGYIHQQEDSISFE